LTAWDQAMIEQHFITPSAAPQTESETGVIQREMAGTSLLRLHEVFIERDTVVAEHEHPNDQVSYVVYGRLEVTVGGETRICTAGDSYAAAGGVVHGAKALTDSLVVVVFSPPG
jgi:quercetin dioxygenase-like cupin family protein